MSPLSRYDSAYGGKPGSARKALASMRETYGKEKADRVFYAKVAQKRPGLLKRKD
jgi:hypothetical protein